MNSKESKKIKILHVIPNLLKGGAQRLAIDICNELNSRNNVETRLIYFEGENEFSFLTKDIKVEKCSASVIPSLTGKNKIEIENYEHFIDGYEPDIIHSHLYGAELVTRERFRKNIKYFTHCHDNMRQLQTLNIKTFRSKQKIVEFYERKLLIPKYVSSDSGFIAISKDTQSYFQCVLPNSLHRNIFLLHNAVNIKKFTKTAEIKVKNEKIDYPIKLINIGNLLEKKNQMFLLDIIESLKKAGVKVHLKIVGDGIKKQQIAESVQKRNLTKEIQMTGSQDNVAELLGESSIYVHTALYEPFGLVLVEAMALGLPVISLDGKGNKDIIKDGKNGYLILEQNPDLFAEKIKYLINHQHIYNEMSSFAANYAKENFDIVNYVNKLLKIYMRRLAE